MPGPHPTVEDFALAYLSIDLASGPAGSPGAGRAGTRSSALFSEEQLVDSYLGFRQTFDREPDASTLSIFENPLAVFAGPSHVTFSLPNGLLGFFLSAGAGRPRVNDLADGSVLRRNIPWFFGAHVLGIQAIDDEVRPFIEANASNFSVAELEAVRNVYPVPGILSDRAEFDTQLYLDALAQAEVSSNSPEPVSSAVLRFESELKLAAVAGALGVQRETLTARLEILESTLQMLGEADAGIARGEFANLFVRSLCELQDFSQNQPSREVCAAAIAEN